MAVASSGRTKQHWRAILFVLALGSLHCASSSSDRTNQKTVDGGGSGGNPSTSNGGALPGTGGTTPSSGGTVSGTGGTTPSSGGTTGSATDPQEPKTVDEAIRAWRETKYGMFIHYSLSTFDGKEQTPGSSTSVDIHKPTALDVDQWVRVAKESGMKYAVLTAKHSSGFCLWDSKVQWKGKEFDYDVASSPVKTDIVDAFMAACKKYGILPGIYYCTMDTKNSDPKLVWTPSLPYLSAEYFQLMKDHLTELHKKYPAIAIQWLDIPRHLTPTERATLYNLVRGINPKCMIAYNYGQEIRDVSGEYTINVAKKVTWPTDIFNSEIVTIKKPFQSQQEDGGKTYELGYEHCVSIDSTGWFWDANSKPMSISALNSLWNTVRDLNGNMLLNVPPDKTGQIPEMFIKTLAEFKSHTDK